MSDEEVLIEYLQLLSLDHSHLTMATSAWIHSALVDYRKQLADSTAAKAEAAASNSTGGQEAPSANSSSNASGSLDNGGLGRGRKAVAPLLTSLDAQLSAVRLLGGNGSYPLARARSAVLASEDFAVVMAAVLQVCGDGMCVVGMW